MKKFWMDLKALKNVKNVNETINHITNQIEEGYEAGVTEEGVLWHTLDNGIISFMTWNLIKLYLFIFKH